MTKRRMLIGLLGANIEEEIEGSVAPAATAGPKASRR